MKILFVNIESKLTRVIFNIYTRIFLRNVDIKIIKESSFEPDFTLSKEVFDFYNELIKIIIKLLNPKKNDGSIIKTCLEVESGIFYFCYHMITEKSDFSYFLPQMPYSFSLKIEREISKYLNLNSYKFSFKLEFARFIIGLAFFEKKIKEVIKSIILFFLLTFKLFFWNKKSLPKIGQNPIAWLGTSPIEMSTDESYLSLPIFLFKIMDYFKNNILIERKFNNIVVIASIVKLFNKKTSEIYFLQSFLQMRLNFSFIVYWGIFFKFLWKLIEVIFFPILPLKRKLLLNSEIQALFYEYIFKVHNFKSLIITCSYLYEISPQLAMLRLKKPIILVNYSCSISTLPKNFNDKFLFYHIKYNPYNYSLVWNDLMEKRNIEEDLLPSQCVENVGPLLFCSPPPQKIEDYFLYKDKYKLLKGKIIISVFDLTPFVSNAMAYLDMSGWIYQYDYVKTFIDDILNSCKQIFGDKFVLLMKPKRTPKIGLHDMRYFQFLESIDTANQNNIILYDPNTNPWHLLGLSNLTISIPYTSTSEASHFLNNPSIYYSPTKIVKSIDEDMLETIYGVDELKNWLEKNKNFKEKTSEEIESYHFKVGSVIEKTACAINKFIEESEKENK